MKVFAFALTCYAAFLLAILGGILFFAIGVDHGPSAPFVPAVAMDLALLGVFAVQHTVMARRGFKALLKRFVPPEAERSLFVLAASASLLLVYWQWRPLPQTVWSAGGAPAAALWVLFAAGWLTVVGSTFMIDHFDLFGLRQGWLALRRLPYTPPSFQEKWLYAHVRHPLMTGFLIALWATPRMTFGHLLFATASTGYIALGVWFEERDLLREIPAYAAYRARVGAVVPHLRRRPGLRSQDDEGVPGPRMAGGVQGPG